MTCKYKFVGADGKSTTITGQAAFKAYLVEGGLAFLQGKAAPKFSKRQTETPEFKRWFGDSKVVDKNGEPLVVYHGGLLKGVTVFDTSRVTKRTAKGDLAGTYFTPDKMYASTFTREFGAKVSTPRGDITQAYLKIENPLNTTKAIAKYRKQGLSFGDAKRKALDALTPKNDGVIFEGDNLNPPEYVVFKPEQIKSATENVGTFDITSPDIRFQRRQTETPEFKRFFKDSKVVDANGKPLVMYHTTSADFNTFDTTRRAIGGEGSWFSNTPIKAYGDTGENIMPVYLSLQNPKVSKWGADVLKKKFIEEGYDGVVQMLDGKIVTAIAFYPFQIKSTTGNVGTFDITSSDIRLQRRQTETPEFEKWFGDSKVVDENNEPLVVYRGTRTNVSKLDTTNGVYFTDNTKAANIYAGETEGANVIPAYLSIANPYTAKSYGDIGVFTKEKIERLKKQGFDGAVFTQTQEDGTPYTEYVVFEPTQIRSATSPDVRFQKRQNIFAQPAPLANWTAPLQTKGDNVVYALQNKLIDTKRVIEAISQAGNQIENDWNVYLQEELFHGRTAKQTADFLQTELRPLVEDMRKRGVTLPEFEEYLHNRHAEERNEQIAKVNPNMPDGGSGIDTADAKAYLAGLTPDQKRDYSALAGRIDSIGQNTRDLLVNSGLESQDTVDSWEKAYSNYVPLYRDDIDFSTQGAGGMGTGQGFSTKGPSSRRAMGSKKAVIDILANIAMQRERAIVRAEKNRVAMSLYGLVVQNPNTDFWLAIDPVGQKKPKQAIADLISMGINPLDAQNIIEEPKQQYIDPNTGLVAERINPAIRSNPMVIATRIDGVEKYVFFNANDERSQRMASALKNLDADQLGYITSNFIAPITRWFAQVNTQFNPIFGAINFIRDVQGGVLNLSSTALAGEQATVAGEVFPAMKGIYQAIRAERKGRPALAGSYAQLWDEFQQVGGQTGYRDQFVNSEDRAKALQRMLDPASWATSPLGKVFTASGTLKVPMEVARKTAAPLFDWLSDYNQTMENAVRLASYKVALDKGLSKEEAASIAKNLTVNFNRKGQIATQAGAWYAFFNASIQGNARYIETLRSPMGKKIIAGGLMIGTAQALLLAAAGFDEDEPPDFIKERNLVIPLGTGGKYFTFPMPLGFNVIPNTSRVMTEWALSGFKNTPKRVGQITGAFLETFNPIGNSGWSVQTLAPTIFDPVAALAENKDFTGKNIAKKDRSDLSPTPGYTRTKDTASWFSKQFSYYLNLATGGTDYKPGLFSPTPDQIDYLIGQVTGGVGREAMKIEQSITGAVKGEEIAPYKIPIVGRFYGDTQATANISGKFYENLTTLNKHEAEIEGRKKKREDLGDYYERYPEARLYEKANSIESDIKSLNKRLKEFKEKERSEESIKIIKTQITAKMKRLNDMVKEAEE